MSQQTILLADDEPRILSLIAPKLRDAGYRVLTASDGQQALQTAMQDGPHLLITDCHLPLLSGLEICDRLQQANAGIPAIILTERGYPIDPRGTRHSHIFRTLAKPFSPRQLLTTVEEVLQDAA